MPPPKRRKMLESTENLKAVMAVVKEETRDAKPPDEERPPTAEDQGLPSIVDLGSRLLAAWDSGFLTDTMILVGDQAIQCHSNIVSFASHKLAAILTEKKPCLPDVDPDCFRLLLQIVYGGKTSEAQDLDTLLQVGRLAHKLQVPTATAYCAETLGDNVEADNLWDILDFADLIYHAGLKAKCLQTICDAAPYLLTTEGFLTACSAATIESILKQEMLHNMTELQLFQACIAWLNAAEPGEAESRRTALKSSLRLIRFRLFSPEEFAGYVCPTGLLCAENERDIMRSCITRENFLPDGFSDSTVPRNPGKIVLVRIEAQYKRKLLTDLPPTIKTTFQFEVNQDIFFHGVEMEANRSKIHSDSFYEENLSVTLQDVVTGRVLQRQTFHEQVKMLDHINIEFEHPVLLYKNHKYSLDVSYTPNCDPNKMYDSFLEQTVKGKSGLQLKVLNEFYAPFWLHLHVSVK